MRIRPGEEEVDRWLNGKCFLSFFLSFRSSFYFSNNFLIDIPKVLKNCKIQILPKKKKKFILESYVRSDSDFFFLLIFLDLSWNYYEATNEIIWDLVSVDTIATTRGIQAPSSPSSKSQNDDSSLKKKRERNLHVRNINFSSIPYFLSQRGEKQPSSFRGGVYLGGGARFTKEAARQEKRGGWGSKRGWLDGWATSYGDKSGRLLADVRAICARVGRDNADPIDDTDRSSCIYVVLSHLFPRYTRFFLFLPRLLHASSCTEIGSLETNALILSIGDSRRDYRFVIRGVCDRFPWFLFNFVPIEFKII